MFSQARCAWEARCRCRADPCDRRDESADSNPLNDRKGVQTALSPGSTLKMPASLFQKAWVTLPTRPCLMKESHPEGTSRSRMSLRLRPARAVTADLSSRSTRPRARLTFPAGISRHPEVVGLPEGRPYAHGEKHLAVMVEDTSHRRSHRF